MIIRKMMWLPVGLLCLALWSCAADVVTATDDRDIAYLQTRTGQILENEKTGVEIEWLNEATGNSGMIRVLRTYFPKPNEPCRLGCDSIKMSHQCLAPSC